VIVTWTPRPSGDRIVGYAVYRDGLQIGQSAAASYTDTTAAELRVHTYAVASIANTGVTSELSASATILVLDGTPPRIVSTVPATGTANLELLPTIRVVFSESVDATTLTSSSFNVHSTASNTPVAGNVTYIPASNAAEWKPAASLPPEFQAIATVTTAVKDLAGNALKADYTFSFSTKETVPPRVTGFTPPDGSTGVSLYTKSTMSFSEPMKRVLFRMQEINTNNGVIVAGSFDSTRQVVTLAPLSRFKPLTTYRIQADSSSALDLVGNTIAATPWFTITYANDFILPRAISTSPSNGATGVSTQQLLLQTTFDNQILPLEGYTLTFDLRKSDGTLLTAGSYIFDYFTAGLTYRAPTLEPNTGYTVTMKQSYTDPLGQHQENTFTWGFTTGA
jgi:hypothetical protein